MDNGFYLNDMGPILIILFLYDGHYFRSYWVWFYLSFKHIKELHSDPAIYQPGVSIIVCYKNAGVQIYHTIEAILKQQYNNFEVIAIDDFSSDDGPDRLKSMDDHRLILMTANLNRPGKKAALSEAIREAKNDILLFTDADCIPLVVNGYHQW
jgi:biofilm PGA synthesis N-glycosyltransferase PgaC